MADDAQKTEGSILLSNKGNCPFVYASRYGTEENHSMIFVDSSFGETDGR